jgi:ubiquinone/menaquinone biosynthesis C-methylase UbiE
MVVNNLISSNSQKTTFDKQANTFDKRAGLEEKICQEIVKTVINLSNIQSDDILVEIGAGTGQIGQWFIKESLQYIGFDLSAKMLAQFRERLSSDKLNNHNWQLFQSDADESWSIEDNTVKVIFSSRTIHRLDIEHIVKESFRIAHPEGCILLVGSVQRQGESVKHGMKKQMHHILKEKGFNPKQKQQSHSQLIDLCCQHSAKKIEPVIVSQWTVSHTPNDSLQNWDQKEGLAGLDIPFDVQKQVLADLEQWAIAHYDKLDQPVESQEEYVLEGVYLK